MHIQMMNNPEHSEFEYNLGDPTKARKTKPRRQNRANKTAQ